MSGRVTVLSIDGGGIRGIIPAMFLADLEQKTDLAASELFDLIVGTSTGGLLALGLVTPDEDSGPHYTASDLVELYRRRGREIFQRPRLHLLTTAAGVFGAKFPPRGLENVLAEYFADSLLGEAVTDVLVTGYEVQQRKPLYFANSIDPEHRDCRMADIARATSAAPTFFPPARFRAGGRAVSAIDGGVHANNPTAIAYAEARQLAGPDAEILVVSLGTGRGAPGMGRPPLGWGLAGWSTRIIDLVFEAGTEAVHRTMEHLLRPRSERGRRSYYRFQVRLGRGDDALDDASDPNVRNLEAIARDMIERHAPEIDELARELTRASEVRKRLRAQLSDSRELLSLPFGGERTDKQRKVAHRIADLASESGYSGQRLLGLLESDETGGAVVLVALMKKNPDPRLFWDLLQHIADPIDPRLQFDALEALRGMLPLLGHEKREAAKAAISQQDYIVPENQGRWDVAQDILAAVAFDEANDHSVPTR